ncbi:MAG: sortase [Chloroflexota bacterium]
MRYPDETDASQRMMEVGVRGGEFEVPAWEVGHHAGSAMPGQPGNSVFAGHLETINAGRVFARLNQLGAGDIVAVYTETHRAEWLWEVRLTHNSQSEFIAHTDDVRITLYTCAGHYGPRTNDYTDRLVVTARFHDAQEPH